MRRGWRGRGYWPGAGPFSHLPPWRRPGWLYGPGACWQLFSQKGTNLPQIDQLKPEDEALILNEQKQAILEQVNINQEMLKKIEARLKELEK